MTLVFVYGSLKRGLSNAGLLHGQRFMGTAVTRPRYRMFDWGGYPGMVERAGDGLAIHGEVYEVDDACLADLDRLEDVDQGLYRRGPVELAGPFHDHRVEAYFFDRPVDGLCDGGVDWREPFTTGR